MHPLKKYLKETGRTRADVAAKVGTSPLYLTHIMAGRKYPGNGLVEALIKETGLTFRDFHPERADQMDRIKELEAQHG